MIAGTDWENMDDDAFRAEIQRFVAAHYPTRLNKPALRVPWIEARDWMAALKDKGWIAPGWPVEHGGTGLSAYKQAVFMQEMDRLGVAQVQAMGIVLLGPLLIHFGTDEQKAHYLPKILSGEHIWCQGYSEPGSGSDLASLRTEAVRDGDHYVVNGHKIWTTYAHYSNMIFMLVRTDKDAKPQKGISFLLSPLDVPGITVRPFRTLTGDLEFCEVFFDDVRIPAANRVGPENDGWSMAKALLGFERINIGSPRMAQAAFKRLTETARALGAFADPAFVERHAQFRLDIEDMTATFVRFLDVLRRGGSLGPEVSILKVAVTETYQRISEAMLDISGEDAAVMSLPDDPDFHWCAARDFFYARPSSIYGGTNEIQRNILAKAVLELPS